jgi:hypothetical protein
MMSPQSPQGDIAQSRVQVAAAVKILRQVATKSTNPAVQSALVGSIAQLTKAFGPFDPRISDTEVMNILARAKGPGSPGNTPQPPPQGAGGAPHPKRAMPPQGGGAAPPQAG